MHTFSILNEYFLFNKYKCIVLFSISIFPKYCFISNKVGIKKSIKETNPTNIDVVTSLHLLINRIAKVILAEKINSAHINKMPVFNLSLQTNFLIKIILLVK